MPWLRVGDTAAMNPIVLAVLEHELADDRTPDELFGYMVRLSTLSAQHTTDYVVSYATALSLGGTKARTDRLLLLAEFAGYGVNEVETESGRRRFRLLDDPAFIHMKTAEEIAFEKQRKADNANPHLVLQVRRRDGDACRYCGNVVNWADRTGGVGGTYDHRPPGEPATGPDSLYVACRTCNSIRGQASQGLTGQAALDAADEAKPPLTAGPPADPYFKHTTVTWMTKPENAVILAAHGLRPPPMPKTKKAVPAGQPAPGAAVWQASSADPAPQSVRPAARPQESATQPPPGAIGSADPAPSTERPAAPQAAPDATGRSQQVGGLQRLAESGRDGSGRDGSGLAGTGRGGRPGHPSPGAKSHRRRRRGRRGGRNPDQQPQPSRKDQQ